jgi:hypothetical protein
MSTAMKVKDSFLITAVMAATICTQAQVKCVSVAGQLAAGVCTYLLIGDSKTSDAKQMILTR